MYCTEREREVAAMLMATKANGRVTNAVLSIKFSSPSFTVDRSLNVKKSQG
jgi:hypothetical protein